MRLGKWTAFVLWATVFILTGCKGASERDGKRVVKVAYLPITHALPLLEAKEELEASDDELQIELVKYGSWAELMDALNTNRVDGASVLIELAMLSKERGVDLKAVALGHKDGNVVVASEDVQRAEDMKGKTFAIPHRQSSHNILLREALAKGGLTVEDATIVELAPPEMPAALAAKQIDGYCVAEPFGAKAVALNLGRALFTSEELWEDSLCCGLVLNGAFLEKRPEDAARFVESYKTAGKNLTKEQATAVGKKFLGQTDDVLDVSLKWISYDDLELTAEIYNLLREKAIAAGLTENPPTYEDFVKSDL